MKGTNIFKLVLQGAIEEANGKLRQMPNGYVFSDAGATNSNGVFFPACKDEDGKAISLKLGLRVVNNCPIPPGDYPKLNSGHCVPLKDCKRCEHHRPRRKGANYPMCEKLRSNLT